MSDLTVEELRRDFSVFDAARERGESVFLRTPEEDLTYTEVARLVADRIASFERPAPGRPHVLVARNDLASIVEILACLELEVPLVLLHPGLTELEQKALREEIAAKRDPLPEGAASSRRERRDAPSPPSLRVGRSPRAPDRRMRTSDSLRATYGFFRFRPHASGVFRFSRVLCGRVRPSRSADTFRPKGFSPRSNR